MAGWRDDAADDGVPAPPEEDAAPPAGADPEPGVSPLEVFAELARGAGLDVDASQLPPLDIVRDALDGIDMWFWDLPPEIREGYDEATAEYPVASVLADPEVRVGSTVPALLTAFDVAGRTLSDLVVMTRALIDQAEQGEG